MSDITHSQSLGSGTTAAWHCGIKRGLGMPQGKRRTKGTDERAVAVRGGLQDKLHFDDD